MVRTSNQSEASPSRWSVGHQRVLPAGVTSLQMPLLRFAKKSNGGRTEGDANPIIPSHVLYPLKTTAKHSLGSVGSKSGSHCHE